MVHPRDLHKICLFTFLLLSAIHASCQQYAHIQAIDSNTRIPVENAIIKIGNFNYSSDINGIVTLPCGSDSILIEVSHISYLTKAIHARIECNQVLLVSLQSNYYYLPTSGKTQGSVFVLDKKFSTIDLDKSPEVKFALFNSTLASLQNISGIVGSREGNSIPHIRGGSESSTALLIDGMRIIRPYHLLGLTTSIDPSIVDFIEVKKANTESSLVEGSESIVSIQSKFDTIGTINSTINILQQALSYSASNDKLSSVTSFRTSQLGNIGIDRSVGYSNYDFYNRQTLATRSKRINFNVFYSRDNLNIFDVSLLPNSTSWNSFSISAGVDHIDSISDHLRGGTYVQHAQYQGHTKQILFNEQINRISITSLTHNFSIRRTKSFSMRSLHELSVLNSCASIGDSRVYDSELFTSNHIVHSEFLLDKHQLNFSIGAAFQFHEIRTIQTIPLFGLDYRKTIKGESSFQLVYRNGYNPVNVLSQSATFSSNDLFILSSAKERTVRYEDFSVSFLNSKKLSRSEISMYYRRLKGGLDFLGGILSDPITDPNVVGVTNRSFGFEMDHSVTIKRISTQIAYTFSRSINTDERQFLYSSNWDIPHALFIKFLLELSEVNIYTSFTLRSGTPVTVAEYTNLGLIIYSDKNEYRLPMYHRLDLGVTWSKLHKNRFESTYWVGIYNVYNRRNIYSLVGLLNDDVANGELRGVTLFPILPMLGYSLKIRRTDK